VNVLSVRRGAIARRLATSDSPSWDLPLRPPVASLRSAASTSVRHQIDDWFEKLVAESGLAWPTETVLLMALASGLLAGGLLFLWRDNPLIAAAGAVLGITMVIVAVALGRARRHRKMREQLPDAISLLSRGVQAGESLEQALQLVGDHADRPVADEFQNCAWQLDMGLSIEATMRALTRRVPIVEVQILASTLVVQRRTGGDLPSALESLSQVIRDRLNYYRQFRVATASARLSSILIASAGPAMAVGMWTFQPDYLKHLLETPQGREMTLRLATIAGVLYVLGVVWAFRLLRANY
jgi:tight adherence protein B